MTLGDAVSSALGVAVRRSAALSGGCVGDVRRVELADGAVVVAKHDPGGSGRLDVEGAMLRDLAERTELPVPAVLHADPSLLVMEHLPGSSGCALGAEEHAAELIAGLHAVEGAVFGYDYDTLIGGLRQPNPQSDHWLPFFAEHRLAHMARDACSAGRLGAEDVVAVERVASRLEQLLDEPAAPALLHGDLWSGNVLSSGDSVTGFIDPAIHFGHPEVELAFTTLFHSFGDRFYARYREIRGGLGRDFWDARRHVYNLYPLLVHVRLFGGGYVGDVRRTCARFA